VEACVAAIDRISRGDASRKVRVAPGGGGRSTSKVYMHIGFANFYLLSITGPKMPADLKQCAAASFSQYSDAPFTATQEGCSDTREISGDGKWKERVLHRFTGGVDGGLPSAGFILDSARNLYSTTSSGGTAAQGTLFEIKP
jgi:hypothetical protein